jgi:hypothetical protein
VTFNHKNGKLKRRKNCIVEWENAFFKSSPVDEYHLPQMNSEKNFLGVIDQYIFNYPAHGINFLYYWSLFCLFVVTNQEKIQNSLFFLLKRISIFKNSRAAVDIFIYTISKWASVDDYHPHWSIIILCNQPSWKIFVPFGRTSSYWVKN